MLSRLHDRAAALKKIRADGAYAGRLLHWACDFGGWTLEVVRRKKGQKGFQVLPRRWVVERTLAWSGKCRRLAKEYETLTASSEGGGRPARVWAWQCGQRTTKSWCSLRTARTGDNSATWCSPGSPTPGAPERSCPQARQVVG